VAELGLPATAKHGTLKKYIWFYAESEEQAQRRAANSAKIQRRDCRVMWVKRAVPEIPRERCNTYVPEHLLGYGTVQRR
jgi:hypothetical protein